MKKSVVATGTGFLMGGRERGPGVLGPFEALESQRRTLVHKDGVPYMRFIGAVHLKPLGCEVVLLRSGAAHCNKHQVDSLPPEQPLNRNSS